MSVRYEAVNAMLPKEFLKDAPEGGEIGMHGCDARERLQSDYRAAAEAD